MSKTQDNTETVEAKDVREGDFLPGLDNGFVFQDAESDLYLWMGEGSDNPYVLPEDSVRITFHTQQGDEAYLICPSDMPVTVQRG